jgi:NAD+ synthase (glutamine-hydrolysing)
MFRHSFLDALPSAELIPIGADNAVQSDEVEMGMTYDELSVFGRLRKVEKCGPYSMFGKLVQEWGRHLSPTEVSDHSRYGIVHVILLEVELRYHIVIGGYLLI